MTRVAAGLVLLLVTPPGLASDGPSDDNVVAEAEAAFARGCELRGDSVGGRPYFARAAAAYEELWRRGHHNPALALNRARAHRLAGDLPGSIAAFHEGLVVARHDRSLQAGREEARGAVAYPLDGELAAECRPKPRPTIGTRMSPGEAYLVAAVLWLLACAAAVRFWMTRATAWLVFSGLCIAGLILLGWLWWQDAKSRDVRPLVIVKADADLRKGNGPGFPLRSPSKLPRGVEARELSRRGGWVQVELAGGAVGWLPESAVLTVRTD
jgi:hypothetical protein